MNELVQSFTSLPNLHPALVHFPIALVPVALLFELLGLVRRQRGLAQSAALLWVLAALGAGAAYWAGDEAGDSLVGVPPQVQAHIGLHSDWALYTLWAVGVVAALRLAVGWLDRRGEGFSHPWLRWLLFAAGVVVLGLVLRTADLGGGLVFRYSVAVGSRAAADSGLGRSEPGSADVVHSEPTFLDPGNAGRSAAAEDYDHGEAEDHDEAEDHGHGEAQGGSAHEHPAKASPSGPLTKTEDGFLWSPAATDRDALGTVLTAAPGSSLTAVSTAEGKAQGDGLGLFVQGRSLLVLPGTFGNVQVEAVLDLSSFEGTAGVIHHVESASAAGLFTVSTAGKAKLAVLEQGKEKVLDEQPAELSKARVTLAVSAAGRHLKGIIQGKTVVHGHAAPAADGGCGILLDGKGTVRVISLRLTPLQ